MGNWIEENNALQKEFSFNDFKEAWAFMTEVAMYAESQNHHPNWSNVYNTVKIYLNTHDAGDIITDKDHYLAQSIDHVYAKFEKK